MKWSPGGRHRGRITKVTDDFISVEIAENEKSVQKSAIALVRPAQRHPEEPVRDGEAP